MADSSTQTESLTSLRYAFRTIVWPRRKMLALGLLLVLVNRAAGLVLPGAPKYLLDEIVPAGDTQQLYLLLFGVGVAVLIQAVSSFALVRLLSVEAQYLIAELRVKVQQQVLRLPVRYFDNTKSGTLVSRIMTDVEGIRNLVGTGFTQLIGGLLTAIGALVILIYLNPVLTFFSVIPLIVFGFIMLKAFGYIRPIFRDRAKIQAEVTGRLTESMSGIRVIKGFHAEDQEARIFREGVLRLFNNVKRSLTATSLVTSSGTFLAGLTTVGILAIGGPMIMDQTLSAGDLFSFILYLALLIFPVVQMSNIGSQLTEAFAGLDRTEELLRMPRETDDPNRTIEIGPVQGDISFVDVRFGYEDDKEVLHGISFDAPAGSVTALVGSSGSGKTTIASLAASFLTPDSGRITIDGQDMSQVTLDSFRAQLGVVLQDDFLFEGTIRANILFPRPDATEEELQAAVAAAYVKEFTDRFEDGLDTLIGERGVKLSGGQRQRIAIARAILANPRILVLDEATSNLDTESETFIQKSLSQLMEGRTTFVIAHRLSTIRQADQILVIEAGQIVERGTHDELIAREGRYFDLYTYQSRI
ncbi:MAG: ABC transporter ATP-binding protein [Bacteroidetes bacterium]|nr:MAG: ABC transporter ATP-binding protein [Bacteroidota bacterium]